MKGDETVREHLQKALTMEFTAVHQYLLHAHVLETWGLRRLADKMREEMREELGHADRFAARMMFLEGEPDAQSMGSVDRAQTLEDMFKADLQDEYEARRFYTEASQTAAKAGDLGTEALFREIALDEEGHIDWLETQLDLLGRVGEAGFYQLYAAPLEEDEED
jgi:bacterioferritin